MIAPVVRTFLVTVDEMLRPFCRRRNAQFRELRAEPCIQIAIVILQVNQVGRDGIGAQLASNRKRSSAIPA